MPLQALSPGAVRVLREFTTRRRTTQPALKRELGASSPTVFRSVAQLRELGIVHPDGGLEHGQGRPAEQFGLAADGFGVLALLVQADQSSLHLVDAHGFVRETTVIEVSRNDDYDVAVDRFVDAARAMLPAAAASFPVVAGLGVAFAGSVDAAAGRLTTPSRFPSWHGRPLASDLGNRVGLPCALGNDATSLVQALLWFSREQLPDDFALLVVDLGLGAGFSFAGTVHTGRNNVPPGLAHTRTLAPSDFPCHCGSTGCLETVLSIPGVLRRAAQRGLVTERRSAHDREVFFELTRRAATEDGIAELLAETGELSGRIADTVARMLDVDTVVFSGALLRESPHAWQAMTAVLESEHATGSVLANWFQLHELLAGDHAEAVGATAVILDNLHSSPEVMTFQ